MRIERKSRNAEMVRGMVVRMVENVKCIKCSSSHPEGMKSPRIEQESNEVVEMKAIETCRTDLPVQAREKMIQSENET